MMSQQDTSCHRFVQGFAEIIVFNVIDQGTGVDSALTILPDNHFAEITHKFGAALGTQVAGHATFGDFRNLRKRAGQMKLRKPDDG